MTRVVDVIQARPEHAGELARICFEAFGALHERHRTPRDFESVEAARGMMDLMTQSPAFVGFVAVQDGRVVGSNFLSVGDPVAGVGPITVDPACQSRGIGRTLMRAVLDEASRRGIARVRLLQEAINTTSLSLYTSLGFTWRDSVAIMQPAAAGTANPAIRPMTEADLDAVDVISRQRYGCTRRGGIALALGIGFPAFVHASGGRVTAYLIPGFLGHGFADDVGTMVGLVAHVARAAPPPFQRVLVPLSQGDLFRELLRQGCRTVKVMSYMTVGEFTAPRGVWVSSIMN